MWINSKARASGDQNAIDTDVARSGLTPNQTDYYSDDWICDDCVLDLDDPGVSCATLMMQNLFIYTYMNDKMFWIFSLKPDARKY